jgi:hypothetical protein
MIYSIRAHGECRDSKNGRDVSARLGTRRDEVPRRQGYTACHNSQPDRLDGRDRGDHLISSDLTRLTIRLIDVDHIDQIGLLIDQIDGHQTIKLTGVIG